MTANTEKLMSFGDTVNLLAQAFRAAADPSATNFHYNESTGEYDNIESVFALHRDGKVYSVKVPLSSYTTVIDCVKDDAMTALVCEPSTNAYAGRDDTRGINLFECRLCNFTTDADGVNHITAIQGEDTRFALDGSNGDVGVLRPVHYRRIAVGATHTKISRTDTPRDGFVPEPGAKMPDGSIRPYMVHAAYGGSNYEGRLASVSGQPLWTHNMSHNTLVNMKESLGGASGKTHADDTYMKEMFLLKYAKKGNEGVMRGCVGYDVHCNPAVSEEGVKRVIVPNATAANLLVGSAVQIGTNPTASGDRNRADCYDVADKVKILSIEPYDANNKAVNLELDSPIDVYTTYTMFTAPWRTGACDNVQGVDGSPTNNTSGKEPFKIQNIETMYGAYEILGNVIIDAKALADESCVDEVHICYDTANVATSITDAYVDTGVSLPVVEAAGWQYATDFVDAGGLLVPQGTGGTSTTGLMDAVYQNAYTSKGTREWLGLGSLNHGGGAGLWCVYANNWLGVGYWSFASRRSALGRSAA